MPLTPDEQAALDERFEALEDRNAKLERLIRSGKAFTSNPLALATDLDDLGSVKTHLDFEEAPLTPSNPQAEVGRVFGVGRTGVNDASLRYIDKDGNISEITHAPSVRAYNSSNIAIPNDAFTVLTLNSERYDTDGMHSTSTNTGRLTATTAGIYVIWGGISWEAAGVNSRRGLQILLGTSVSIAEVQVEAGAITHIQNVSTIHNMAAGDYVQLRALQDGNGGGLQVIATERKSPEFAMTWLAPAP